MSRDRSTSRLGLSTSEAAKHLGVSLSTVRRWSDAGHLRGYRTPGGQRRFTVEQLDEFLVLARAERVEQPAISSCKLQESDRLCTVACRACANLPKARYLQP